MSRLTLLARFALTVSLLVAAGCPSASKGEKAPPQTIDRDAASAPRAAAHDSRVSRLVRELAAGSAQQRWRAHHDLAALGARAQAELLGLLQGSDPALRQGAARALAAIGAPAKAALGPLLSRLVDEDAGVRLATVQTLARLHPPPERLRLLLVDGDARVRQAAASLLASQAPTRARRWLVAQLAAPRPWARAAAAEGLGRMGKDAAVTLQALIGAATDREARVREAVYLALVRIGPGRPEVVAALAGGLQDPTPFVRLAAAAALRRAAEASAEQARPKLARALAVATTDDNSLVRQAACRALAGMGEAAAPAVGALAQVLAGDPKWQVKVAAADALGALGSGGAAAVKPLAATLAAPRASLACAAGRALGRLAARLAPARRALRRASARPALRRAVACSNVK